MTSEIAFLCLEHDALQPAGEKAASCDQVIKQGAKFEICALKKR